ncbi:MAG TPA: hypothetical protein PLA80_13725, partial [Synergistaceae bacterium]|nr:hypothetical protein [Synergistaceae bacterium]
TLAWSSFLYKIAGILLLLPLYRILPAQGAKFFPSPAGSIAFIQSALIWGNALALLPFTGILARGGAFFAQIFGRENPGEPLYLEFPPPPFPSLALSLLSKEMIRGANLMEECIFRTLRTPWASERLARITEGSEELMESCTEYLLALPPPLEESSEAPEEYASLAHGLSCMRELNHLILQNFLPQYESWKELPHGTHAPSQQKEWEALAERLLLLLNESFGAFALGDSRPSKGFIRGYEELRLLLEELQTNLETTRGLFHTPGNLRLWELLHTLRSMAQHCFCLAQQCSLREIAFPPERGKNKTSSGKEE